MICILKQKGGCVDYCEEKKNKKTKTEEEV